MEELLAIWEGLRAGQLGGRPITDYLQALGLFAASLAGIWVFQTVFLALLRSWTQRTSTDWDDFFVDQIQKRVVPLLYFAALYITARQLEPGPLFDQIMHIVGTALVTFMVVRFVSALIKKLLLDNENKALNDRQKLAMKGLYPALSAFLWVFAVVFLLDNFGFDISAVVAGLGVGGVAVALAAQAILGDLFSYFAIILDRPFEIGDFIIVGDVMGNIEHIGLKTTRLRSISGEEVILCNKDLTSSRVRNFKRMFQRRVVFRIGVVYETPLEKVRLIPQLIQNAIEQQADVRFDRAHFFQFGPHSLDFEAVYFVLDGDYTHYMDIQQAINLALIELFQREGIVFAYPTQVVLLRDGES